MNVRLTVTAGILTVSPSRTLIGDMAVLVVLALVAVVVVTPAQRLERGEPRAGHDQNAPDHGALGRW
jgi:hypothetical protein